MNKSASLKDIARKVGVSITLVSYVLGGKEREKRVSEVTAKKINRVAKELNYRPNLNARSLKTNKTRTIGVIVADISNPFFANMARIIEDEAFSQDYTVIFGSSDENELKFSKVLNLLISRKVDGFIIAAPEGSKEVIKKIIKAKIPLVLIDRYFVDIDVNYVIVDNFRASISATNYLIGKGAQRIGTVMYSSELDHYKDRYNGYLEALKRAEISFDLGIIKIIDVFRLKEEMGKALKELIDSGVDAIYFQTNTLAEEGLCQLKSLDRGVFDKIDLVVFDQNKSYHFLEQFIPYVDQPIKEMGERSLKILIDQIEHKQSQSIMSTLNTSLAVEGNSVTEPHKV